MGTVLNVALEHSHSILQISFFPGQSLQMVMSPSFADEVGLRRSNRVKAHDVNLHWKAFDIVEVCNTDMYLITP